MQIRGGECRPEIFGGIMKELTLNTGEIEYRLNDKCTARFNPTDPAFADRIYSALDELSRKQESKNPDNMSTRETFDYLRKLNAEMRETIDGCFDTPVCEPLFGKMSVYASAEGTPLWMNLMLAIIDEFDDGIKREKAFHSEKLAKYTKKYSR